MTREDIQLLFRYDRWANRKILQAVSALSGEHFCKDLGGAFASVRDTLVHIVGGEWIWLAYWKNPPSDKDQLAELVAQRDRLFGVDQLPDLAAVREKWAEIERDQIEFVDGLSEESLEETIPFRENQVKLMHLMQHLVNHSTYHRGQISLMMRQLGSVPVATDFHVFLREADGPRG